MRKNFVLVIVMKTPSFRALRDLIQQSFCDVTNVESIRDAVLNSKGYSFKLRI